jgi:ABC-type Mn2+/Zn2+ transport system ATPase subunit
VASDGRFAIEVENLTVSYGPVPALLDVSVSIPAGQLVGVIGPNGQPADRAKGRVAYVPQKGSVDWDFPITVNEVALMGRYGHVPWWRELTAHDRAKADEALEMVRMSAFRDRQIGQLSGGQQQRVFMARAMAQGAEILLLDEPFAGVDAATEHAILDVLHRTKAAGRTLVVVHHDLVSAAEYFDSLILLKQRLFAFGPPQAVLQPDLLTEVYEGRVQAFTHLAAERHA